MFAQIYKCPTHGDTWQPIQAEDIDTERDEVYRWMCCPVVGCHHSVEPVTHDGKPVMHVLTEDEMCWEMWSDPDDYDGSDEDWGDE